MTDGASTVRAYPACARSPRSGDGAVAVVSTGMPSVPGWPVTCALYSCAPPPASRLKCGANAVRPFAAAGGRPVVVYRGSGMSLLRGRVGDELALGRPRRDQRIGDRAVGPQVRDDESADDGTEQGP